MKVDGGKIIFGMGVGSAVVLAIMALFFSLG